MTKTFAFIAAALFSTVTLLGAESPPAPIPPAPPEAFEEVEVAINAPATNYGIRIVEMRKVGGELWVLSKVEKRGDFGGAAITKVSDRVRIAKVALPVKHFVAGKTWGWADPETVTYLAGETITDERWKDGTLVWKLRDEKG